MKNKIGIVTFHESINYGAYLQAYALSNTIEKEVKLKTELVNYTPFYKRLFYYVKAFSKITKGKLIIHLRQISVFTKAQKNLSLSRRISTNDYQKHCRFMNDNYLAVIIGSDEVLSAGKSRMMPFPNIYWPNESVTIPKFTYAGSANRATYAKLSPGDKNVARSVFQHYTYVGVRDYYSQDQVLSLDPTLKTHLNCDPTFLMDFNVEFKKERNALQKKLAKMTSKPIIVLLTKNDSVGLQVKKVFGKEYFILAAYYPNKGADYFMADMSPQEWAVAFGLYTACITQLFHGTAFCLKNNLPFVSFDNNAQYDNRATKISDLLSRSDLMENYFNLRKEGFNFDQLTTQLKKNIENPQKEKMMAAVEDQKALFSPFLAAFKRAINR